MLLLLFNPRSATIKQTYDEKHSSHDNLVIGGDGEESRAALTNYSFPFLRQRGVI